MGGDYLSIQTILEKIVLHCRVMEEIFLILETSRKWLTVAIFRKWQDSSVALLIEIAVILNWS